MLTGVHSGPQGEVVKRRVDTGCQTFEKLQHILQDQPLEQCMTDCEASSRLDLRDDKCVQHKNCSHAGMWPVGAQKTGPRPHPLLALHSFFLAML